MSIFTILDKFIAGEIQPGEVVTSREGVIFTALAPNQIRIEYGGRIMEFERQSA